MLRKVINSMIALGVLITLMGCGEEKVEEVKMGAILPLTGALSFIGELDRNGFDLAMEEIKSSGGIKGREPRLLIQDNQGKAEQTVTVFRMFHDVEKVKVVFTPTTTPTYAVKPLAEEYDTLLVGLCMDPTIQEDSKMVFRLYEGLSQEAETILDYFKEIESGGKIAILYVKHPGTEQQVNEWLVPGFKKLGSDIVLIETYELTDKDFKPVIAKIRDSKATHLVIIGYGFLYPQIFSTLKEQKLLGEIKIVGGWGFIAPNKTPQELLEGVIVAAPEYILEKNEKAQMFVRRYKEKFGEEPNFEAAFAYNGLMMVSEAARKARDLNPQSIAESLSRISEYNGILGRITLSPSGDMLIPMGLGVYKQGKVEPLH